MTLTISLPSDAETLLTERARGAGQDVEQYVEQLIARELAAPLSLADAAEPLARAVDAAGVTDDEFTSILVEARDGVRATAGRQYKALMLTTALLPDIFVFQDQRKSVRRLPRSLG